MDLNIGLTAVLNARMDMLGVGMLEPKDHFLISVLRLVLNIVLLLMVQELIKYVCIAIKDMIWLMENANNTMFLYVINIKQNKKNFKIIILETKTITLFGLQWL